MGDQGEIDWNKTDGRGSGGRGRRLRAVEEGERGRDKPDFLAGYAGEYHYEKFYLRSSDEHGHRMLVRNVNLPQSLAAAFGRLREEFPEYRSNADVVRDAVMHLLFARHQQMNAEPTEMMLLARDTMELEYNIEVIRRRKERVQAAKDGFKEALEAQDWERLEKHLETVERMLEVEGAGGEAVPDAYKKELWEMHRQYSGELKRVRDRGEWT